MKIDEESAYQALLLQIPKKFYKRLVTVGRGGLGVTQKLAYDLDIKKVKVVENVSEIDGAALTDLFVDDIEDTSMTIVGLAMMDTAVLVQKDTSMQLATYVGKHIDTLEYIHFSWEGNENE